METLPPSLATFFTWLAALLWLTLGLLMAVFGIVGMLSKEVG